MSNAEHRRIRSYRREWARRLISRGNTPHNPPPRYGSPEWCNLPDSHPAKIAAVVLAAESWAWGNDVLSARDRAAKAHDHAPGDAEGIEGPLCWDWRHITADHNHGPAAHEPPEQPEQPGGQEAA